MYSDNWPGFYHGHRGAKTGQFLVVGPERTYALQAFHERNRESPRFTPQTRGYLLIADRNDSEPVLDFKTRGATKGLGYTRTQPPVWHLLHQNPGGLRSRSGGAGLFSGRLDDFRNGLFDVF